jgi:type II secretory pathway pseudopilin PulG
MPIRSLWHVHQDGDTIVEVLISMAIVSVILAGAYAITTQDLKATQDASERSQAQQLVQQQIELLRPYAATGTTVPDGNCLQEGGLPATGGVTAVSGANCQLQGGSGTCTSSFCYTVAITQPTAGSYEITATWPNQHGSNSSVTMDYGPTS